MAEERRLTEAEVSRLRGHGTAVRELMDKVLCDLGADGRVFGNEELVILHGLELIRLKLFSLGVAKAFRSSEDELLNENLAQILREMKELEFSRLRGRADFQAYVQSGR